MVLRCGLTGTRATPNGGTKVVEVGEAVGVDGCRAGWVAIEGDGRQLGYRIHATMAALLSAHRDARRVLVDIPIGLPWLDCAVRPCDALARAKLQHRHVCVFPAPSREACRAVRAGESPHEARRLNVAAIGKSLSAQALGICDKVAEVDELMLADPLTRKRVREVHPEVCFWALNQRRPMQAAKTSRAGIDERLHLLQRRLPAAPALLERVLRQVRRSTVKADDVLDALVAYLVAAADPEMVRRLAGIPSVDREGLSMEMLYVE